MNPEQSHAPLGSARFEIDREVFSLDLGENTGGRFLKITEDADGHSDTIVLPAGVFREFAMAFFRLAQAERQLPTEGSDRLQIRVSAPPRFH